LFSSRILPVTSGGVGQSTLTYTIPAGAQACEIMRGNGADCPTGPDGTSAAAVNTAALVTTLDSTNRRTEPAQGSTSPHSTCDSDCVGLDVTSLYSSAAPALSTLNLRFIPDGSKGINGDDSLTINRISEIYMLVQ
jgi:hypothetical protein